MTVMKCKENTFFKIGFTKCSHEIAENPWLMVEFLVLFFLMPLLFFIDVFPFPKIPVIIAAALYALSCLSTDPTFDRRRMLSVQNLRTRMAGILFRLFLVTLGLVIAYPLITAGTSPEVPPITPKWLGFLMVYAFLSAIPQEIVYRVFFFHRYRGLIRNPAAMVFASTVLFSYMHIVYRNWTAVALTLVGGFLFSRSYDKTAPLSFASIEHGLYGCACFTLGYGPYFT